MVDRGLNPYVRTHTGPTAGREKKVGGTNPTSATKGPGAEPDAAGGLNRLMAAGGEIALKLKGVCNYWAGV